MKKLIALMLSMVMVLPILAGCRRQTTGAPGDPTVNNSTTKATRPSMTTQPTRSSTESTKHTTIPDSTAGSSNHATGETDITTEPATTSNAPSRNRMITRR